MKCYQQPASTLSPEVSVPAVQSPPFELWKCQHWPDSIPSKEVWIPVPWDASSKKSLPLLPHPEAGSRFPKLPSLYFLRVSALSSRTRLTNSVCISHWFLFSWLDPNSHSHEQVNMVNPTFSTCKKKKRRLCANSYKNVSFNCQISILKYFVMNFTKCG